MAELSNYRAALGRKAMTAISCVHRTEWHSESAADPDLSVWTLKVQEIPTFPPSCTDPCFALSCQLGWHFVQPPLGAGRGEMDAPFHAPAPPQAARKTPVFIYLECRWREALIAKSREEDSILIQLMQTLRFTKWALKVSF